MATADSVKAKIQGLISKANAKTGRSDADMTNAVNALVSGYNPNGITPSGTINITSNGTHNVTNYASASVNVPTGISPTGTINITTNGTHNVTNYASANVNVPVGEDVTTETNTYTSLLADLENAVNSLPEGGGGGSVETCTVTINSASSLYFDYITYEDGNIVVKSENNEWGLKPSVSFTIVKHSLFTIYYDGMIGLSSYICTGCRIVRDLMCESDGYSIGAVVAIDSTATNATISVS